MRDIIITNIDLMPYSVEKDLRKYLAEKHINFIINEPDEDGYKENKY